MRSMKKEKKSVELKKVYAEEEIGLGGVLDEDDFSEHNYQQSDDNPFKELQTLVTAKDIDVKTFLSERQVVVMHKLSTLSALFHTAGNEEGAGMIDHYINRFMTLIINKNGLSRSQYIEAIGKGRERAEESRREHLADKMGSIL